MGSQRVRYLAAGKIALKASWTDAFKAILRRLLSIIILGKLRLVSSLLFITGEKTIRLDPTRRILTYAIKFNHIPILTEIYSWLLLNIWLKHIWNVQFLSKFYFCRYVTGPKFRSLLSVGGKERAEKWAFISWLSSMNKHNTGLHVTCYCRHLVNSNITFQRKMKEPLTRK